MYLYSFNTTLGVITKVLEDSDSFSDTEFDIVVPKHPIYYLKLNESLDEVAIAKFRDYFQGEISRLKGADNNILNIDTSLEDNNVSKFNSRLSLDRLKNIISAIPTKVEQG